MANAIIPTAFDCFKSEHPTSLRIGYDGLTIASSGLTVEHCTLFEPQTRSSFLCIYLPDCPDFIPALFGVASLFEDLVEKWKAGIEGGIGAADGPIESLSAYVMTRRAFIYAERDLSTTEAAELHRRSRRFGWYVEYRGPKYVANKYDAMPPLAFISHDHRDKESIARPLAYSLLQYGKVWYDEFTLFAGDSLRKGIERGIKESQSCVLILTNNFFSNEGWTKGEFDEIFIREILHKGNIMIPVWSGITKEEVYEYCPRLLDKLGLEWSLGSEIVAARIKQSLDRTSI